MTADSTTTPNGSQDTENTIMASESGNENDHCFIVGWEDPVDKDPENPMNWSSGRKWGIIGILSFLTFLT